MLGSACFALAVPGEARAACVDTALSSTNNCEFFNAPTGNNFSYNVFSGAFGSASANGGRLQITLDGLPSGKTLTLTGLKLTLGNGTSTQDITYVSPLIFTATGNANPDYIGSIQTIGSVLSGTITSAVLSGTLAADAPLDSSVIFSGGLRFNTTGSSDGAGLLQQSLVSGGNFRGDNQLSSQYQASVPGPRSVPGPLPVLGAGMAFGFSRKLRKRISAS